MGSKVVAYNSGTVTAYGTKYGNHEVGTVANDYRKNRGGLTWYNSPDFGNDYVMISNTYDLGLSTQGNAKPLFWIATTDSDFLTIVNKLHDNRSVAPLGTVADAINWVNASNKYYLINTPSAFVTGGLVANLLSAPASGSVWTDAKGAYNGTITNGTYTSDHGGGIILNNGTVGLNYNLGAKWTVEVIAKGQAVQTYWVSLWGEEVWFSRGWTCYASSAGTWNIQPAGLGSTGTLTATMTNINHYTVSYDGSNIRTYLNGVKQNTTASTPPTQSAQGFLFGARHTNGGTGSTDFFKATYYQMRIYNTNISDADVTTNFNAIKTTYGL
jgi:Concanavalin A-like lectin/glucanases superfamily